MTGAPADLSAADADHLGQNDEIFPADGAHPYKRDLETLEFHLLDTGHFALEEDGDLIREFLRKYVG